MLPSAATTRDLLSYGRILLNLAQRHNGQGWLEYDRAFRQQVAADPSIQWNNLNPSHGSHCSVGPLCPHCQEVDHRASECALVSTDPFLESSRPPMQWPKPYSRPSPLDSGTEICRRFNRGCCLDPIRCRYRHICSVPECHKPGHAAYTCPLRQETLRPRIGPPLK